MISPKPHSLSGSDSGLEPGDNCEAEVDPKRDPQPGGSPYLSLTVLSSAFSDVEGM